MRRRDAPALSTWPRIWKTCEESLTTEIWLSENTKPRDCSRPRKSQKSKEQRETLRNGGRQVHTCQCFFERFRGRGPPRPANRGPVRLTCAAGRNVVNARVDERIDRSLIVQILA